jgi:hypothetical protein
LQIIFIAVIKLAHILHYFPGLIPEVMKTTKILRVSLFLLAGFLLLTTYASSQESKPTRQEKKEAKKLQLAANYVMLDSMLNRRFFVLEANYLKNRYGNQTPVSSNINFIRVDGTNGVLQTGSVFSQGYNGLGGVTAEGSIGRWEVSKNPKSKSYNLRFSLNTTIGHYDIVMNISADARAMATITGLGPGHLIWDGHLVPAEMSRVFQGQNTR